MGASRPVVLIVDDEPSLVDLLTAYLGDEFETRSATSGPDALDRLDESVAVVTLDRRMPGMSGDEVARRLRSNGWTGKILMVSAVAEPVAPDQPDWDEYLEKPVSKAEFRNAIVRLLERAA